MSKIEVAATTAEAGMEACKQILGEATKVHVSEPQHFGGLVGEALAHRVNTTGIEITPTIIREAESAVMGTAAQAEKIGTKSFAKQIKSQTDPSQGMGISA